MALPLTRPAAFTVLPAAVLSAYADEIERLATAVFGGLANTAAPLLQVRRTSTLSTANNTNVLIPWQTADIDPDGMWDPGDPTRVTVVTPGAWVWVNQTRWAPNATGTRGLKILGGGNTPGTNDIAVAPPIAGQTGQGPTGQLIAGGVFTAGTPIFVNSFQNSGGALNVNVDFGGTYLIGFWLGPV